MKEIKVKTGDSLYRRPLAVDTLGLFLTFLAAAALVSFFHAMHGCTPAEAWIDLSFALVAFWIILINFKVRFFLFFFVLLAAPFGLIFLTRDPFIRVVYGIFAAFAFGVGIYLRFVRGASSEKESVTGLIAGMALFTLMWFLCEKRDCAYFKTVVFVVSLFYCFSYLLLLHESKIDYNLFLQNQVAFDQPVRRIKRFNSRLFAVALAGLCVLVELLLLIPWDGAVSRGLISTVLLYGFLWLFNFLMSLINSTAPDGGGSFPQVFESLAEEESSASEPLEPGTASRFAEVSGYVFAALIVLAVLAILVIAVIRVYRYFYERGRMAAELEKEKEEIDEIDERLEKPARASRMILFAQKNLSEAERIRLRYFQKLRPQMGKAVLPSDTPEESAFKLKDEELDELLPRYQSIRYAGPKSE